MSFFSSLFGRASSSSPAVTGSTSLPPSATLSAGRSPTYTTTRYTHVEQPHGACPYPPEDRSPTPPPRRVVRRRVVTDRPRPPAPEALSPRARSPTLDPEAEGEAEGDRPPSPNYSPLSPDPRDAPEAPDVPRYPQPLFDKEWHDRMMTHIKDIYEMDEEWEADRRAGNLEGARSTYTGTYIPISSLVNMLAQKIGHHSADKIADLLYHSRDFTPAGFHIDRTHPRDPSPATSSHATYGSENGRATRSPTPFRITIPAYANGGTGNGYRRLSPPRGVLSPSTSISSSYFSDEDEPATAEELGLSVPPGFQPQSRFQSGPSLRRPLNPPRTSGSGRNSLGLTINSTAEQSGSAYRSIAMRASLVPSAATRARSPSPAVKAESPTTPTPAPRRKRRASEIGEGSGSSSSSGTAPQTPPRTSPVKTESLDDAVKTESTHDAPVKTEPADAEAPVKAEPADADEPAPKPKRARKSRTTATPELRVLPDRVGRGRRRMPADELFY